MNMWALITDGAVMSLEPGTVRVDGIDYALADRLHPDVAARAVELTPQQAAEVRVGWLFADGQFAAPSPPGPAPVPASVTGRQARLALLAAGLLDAVEAAIAAAPEAAQIEWRHGATIDRASPLIAEIGGALDLTDAQIDDLFRAAAAL